MRRVVIVGGDRSAWLAAVALQRAFARTGLAVTVVETPSVTPRHAVIATLPELARFHTLLGIEEQDVFRGAEAGFSLGQQFVGWSGGEGAFLHVYGEAGRAIGGLPFLQFWIKARANGLKVALQEFVLAAAAASHDRMPADSGTGVEHGYLVDARGYERLLRERAKALGVELIADAAPTPRVENGIISAVTLSDGRSVEGDLFVDATGPAAALIGALSGPDDVAEGVMPCDRLLLASTAPLSPLPLYSRISAHRAGWLGLFPLASRTGVALAYASGRMSDEEAREKLASTIGRAAENAELVAIRDRWRVRPWIGNCVAIGDAAATGDPLDAVALQRDQIGVAHLLTLFPLDRANMVEAEMFNELTRAHLARLRDFQMAHYLLNARHGEPLWDEARRMPVSEELRRKLDLFAARGMVAQLNHESFNADNWQAVLIGHGLVPRSHDPQVDKIPDGEVARELQAILGSVRARLAAMIPHAAARQRVLSR